MTKLEFNQKVTFTAEGEDRRGNPANVEPGSAVFTVTAADADGNPVDVAFEVDPANELSVTITSGEVAATGVVTLRADGDPNLGPDEVAPVVATADFVIDAPSVVALSLTAGEPVDVDGATV